MLRTTCFFRVLEFVSLQEIAHLLDDLHSIFFEHEVPGIEQVEVNIVEVLSISLSTRGHENWVVCTPDN